MNWLEKMFNDIAAEAANQQNNMTPVLPSTQDIFDCLEELPEGYFATSDQGLVEVSRALN